MAVVSPQIYHCLLLDLYAIYGNKDFGNGFVNLSFRGLRLQRTPNVVNVKGLDLWWNQTLLEHLGKGQGLDLCHGSKRLRPEDCCTRTNSVPSIPRLVTTLALTIAIVHITSLHYETRYRNTKTTSTFSSNRLENCAQFSVLI